MADNITVTEGTAKAIAADDVSSVWYQIVKVDRGIGGSTNLFTGTVDAVTNLAAGTITSLTSGTIKSLQGGTVNNLDGGTVQTFPIVHSDSFSTCVESTGTATLVVKAAVNGSTIYVTDMIVSSNSGATAAFGDGTVTSKLLEVYLGANGGFVSNFKTPMQTTSGSALTCDQPGSGTITMTIIGYVD